ncbi:MAG: hypothetical protein M0R28_22485 [Pigmentiphaga sp.]|nr:hypothetical protein [Pigmentiphaga sp.]
MAPLGNERPRSAPVSALTSRLAGGASLLGRYANLKLLSVKRALTLLAFWVISEPVHAADADPTATLGVLTMNEARMSQVRYLSLLLDRSNIAVTDAGMDNCLDRMVTADEVTRCIRSEGSLNSTRGVILVLNDAEVADRERPGLARLICVGSGKIASDPDRQSITLWPRAYGLRSVTGYAEDVQRLRDCVAAAQAETIP